MAMKPIRRSTAEKYSVDQMMRKTAASLIRDFQINLNEPCFCSELRDHILNSEAAQFRQLTPQSTSEMTPSLFKATYQIASIFKRYRFEVDTYSDSDLENKAIKSFLDTQDRVSVVDLSSVSAFSHVVLDRAATYIQSVLGMYSDEEHRRLCRFGRRASVGIPAAQACEAARWELPISGSPEQISWFDAEMRNVDSVQEYWIEQLDSDPLRSVYKETSSLKLTLVPKTFKSLRTIMPNTTIGSYMSFGLGEMMRKRLKRAGYNIATLQERHKVLARRASVHGLHVTADLSSASDSITDALVERIFPSDWYSVLKASRISSVVLPNGDCIESKTFCTMGIGYTFPLQTLVFLALIKAIESILFHRLDRRTISVYGDDLIYANRMHKQVVSVFGELGFVINIEKTFDEGHFRESCGGDYYHGVDVRPFQPRNGASVVGKRTYEAMLYKYINGLLMRWSEHEIGNTLSFLLSEISRVTGKAKLVPGDYPDDAGIKCPTLTSYNFIKSVDVAKPKHVGHGVFRFSYLRLTSDLRKETRHAPYYWLGLRRADLPNNDIHGKSSPEASSVTCERINSLCGIRAFDGSSLISKEDDPVRLFRSKITGNRVRCTSTFVTVSHTGRYTRQSGTSCFEDRR